MFRWLYILPPSGRSTFNSTTRIGLTGDSGTALSLRQRTNRLSWHGAKGRWKSGEFGVRECSAGCCGITIARRRANAIRNSIAGSSEGTLS